VSGAVLRRCCGMKDPRRALSSPTMRPVAARHPAESRRSRRAARTGEHAQFFGGAMELATFPHQQTFDFEGLKAADVLTYAPSPAIRSTSPDAGCGRCSAPRARPAGGFPYRTLGVFRTAAAPAIARSPQHKCVVSASIEPPLHVVQLFGKRRTVLRGDPDGRRFRCSVRNSDRLRRIFDCRYCDRLR